MHFSGRKLVFGEVQLKNECFVLHQLVLNSFSVIAQLTANNPGVTKPKKNKRKTKGFMYTFAGTSVPFSAASGHVLGNDKKSFITRRKR